MTSLAESEPTNAQRPVRQRLDYMNDFRGVAIVLVALTHIYPASLPRIGLDAIQNATVFFVFISGFFFSYLFRTTETWIGFVRRKSYRVALPYLVSCIPGMLIVWLAGAMPMSADYLLRTIATGIGHRNNAHWFAPFILLIFLAYPLWRYQISRPRALLVGTCFALLVGLLTLRSKGNANPLISFVHFAGVFMLGLLAAAHHDALLAACRRWFWTIVLLGFLASSVTTAFIGMQRGLAIEDLMEQRRVLVDLSLLAKLFLLLPIAALLLRLSDAGRRLRVLNLLAALSFGLFFWHLYAAQMVDLLVPVFHLKGVFWWTVFVRPLLVFAVTIGWLMLIRRWLPDYAHLFGVDPRLPAFPSRGTDSIGLREPASRSDF